MTLRRLRTGRTALGRPSEESAVDQRPYHDHTRFAIDAQQSLGLWQRDAESWHSVYSAWTRRVRSRTVATCLSVSGTVLVTMNVPRDSAYIVRGKKGSKYGFIVSRVTPEISRGCGLRRSRPGASRAWRRFNLKVPTQCERPDRFTIPS